LIKISPFFACGMLLSSLACAQSIDTQQIPDLPVRSVPSGTPAENSAPHPGWNFTLGGGLSYAPRYEGAVRNRPRFMPLLELSYNNGKFFFSPLRGIGYNFSDTRNVQYGLRLAMAMGRKQNVDPHLNGMGNISRTAEFGPYFNWRIAPWYLSGGINASSHGTHAELGGGINLPLSAADRIRLGTNSNWGNAQYNQTYFGVTSAQATASNGVLTPYQPGAGIKDYALTANWTHSFTKEWSGTAGWSFKRLVGSDQYSPLVMRRAMHSFNFLVGYRF
jgi:outer membrane protein